jgi:hypothetical protein
MNASTQRASQTTSMIMCMNPRVARILFSRAAALACAAALHATASAQTEVHWDSSDGVLPGSSTPPWEVLDTCSVTCPCTQVFTPDGLDLDTSACIATTLFFRQDDLSLHVPDLWIMEVRLRIDQATDMHNFKGPAALIMVAPSGTGVLVHMESDAISAELPECGSPQSASVAMDGTLHTIRVEFDVPGQHADVWHDGVLVISTPTGQCGNALPRLWWGDATITESGRVVWDTVFHNGGRLGSPYCSPATPNSTGAPASISAVGSSSVSANDLTLVAQPVPNQPGLFFYGPQQISAPFGNGTLCITGVVGRLDVVNATGNVMTHLLDNASPPSAATQIISGSTWNFQAWFRDPAAGGAFFNLSDGLEVVFDS